MTDLNNPETIEIHGLRTITKLCHFGADNNMEGCTFTEIVERLFAELEKAKAQAVPDTHVILPKEPNDEIIASMKLTWWESDSAHIMKTSVAKSIYAGIVKASESGAEG
ncbi:hypothetical protein [Acinetobacter pittii]|uniref:hypothetical protein n=1 Tax=Acinetobacter pittii TaxID=48296 RepID=UPI000DE70844|nr:hypothetical protein [Acinetobacter pittii]MDP7845767.1 hypothetical protein [Acinetobacter pittii]MDP7869967.1 hypothetical protein [Acinetobacter pittii]UFN54551.1 hypothetical protein LPS07_05415 [Acinetobacter pittii]SSV78964.1 Uncharacterised protein [Acinetobacter pittii]